MSPSPALADAIGPLTSPAEPHGSRAEEGVDISHLVPVDFTTLDDVANDEDPWLIEPVLPARRSVSIVAGAGQGKSLLALDWAASLATGRAVCDRPAGDPVAVVYIDMEMTYDDLAERLEALGYDYANDRTLQENLHYFLMAQFAPFDDKEGGDELLTVVQKYGAAVVVIDTLARVVSGGENDADTYRGFDFHTGKRLKALGMTVLRLDHEGKTKKKGARGSSAKRDDVDVEWRLSVNSAGNVALDLKKGRTKWVPKRVVLSRQEDPLRHIVRHPALTETQKVLMQRLDAQGIDVDASRNAARSVLSQASVRFSNEDYGPAQAERRRRLRTVMPARQAGTQGEVLQDKGRTDTPDHHGPLAAGNRDQWSPLQGDHGPSPGNGVGPVVQEEAEEAHEAAQSDPPLMTWDELLDRAE
jgi:KaiC/GvpD/RAD55 family RecA-like ATPase